MTSQIWHMQNKTPDSLPHNYPFRFLDRVLELSAQKGTAVKNISVNEAFFTGHFRENPIMPGVLIVEAMAQLAGLVMNFGKKEGGIAYLAQIKDMRFRKPVVPGDQLRLVAETKQNFDTLASFSVTAFADNKVVAEGELVMAAG